jgi:transcriptional regulator GlxA family with amidase domain
MVRETGSRSPVDLRSLWNDLNGHATEIWKKGGPSDPRHKVEQSVEPSTKGCLHSVGCAATAKKVNSNLALDVGFLVFPGFELLDVAGPISVFQRSAAVTGVKAYRIDVLAISRASVRSSAGPAISARRLDRGRRFHCFFVVAGDIDAGSKHCLALIKSCAERSSHVVGVHTGTFYLGAAGLIDNRQATTDWRYIRALKRSYPRARVDGNRVLTRDGSIWTWMRRSP